MSEIKQSSIKQVVAEYLSTHDKYLIIMHVNPDGDCVGSAAGLCLLLQAMGKTAYVLPDDDLSDMLEYYVSALYPPDDYAPNVHIVVDTASRARLSRKSPERIDLAIDHHASHKHFAEFTHVEFAAACGEIIYQLYGALNIPLTADAAEALYVAVSTDTGCFRYGNTSPQSHRIAAALMECGFDVGDVNVRFFEQKSLTRLKLEQTVFAGMETLHDGQVIVMTVTRAVMAVLGAKACDTEELSGLTRTVKSCRIGIMLREQDDGVRISVRTVPPYNATAICGALGGGGHAQAAGCTVACSIDEARRLVLDVVYGLYPDI